MSRHIRVQADAKTTDARHPYGMGLIWSPFSNLLLYGETANIASAKSAKVTIALGSDWTPTGSKIAARGTEDRQGVHPQKPPPVH
jgi:hypothetical protein